MAQFNTFYIPMTDDGANAERMNLFLRSHRVLGVRQRDFPEGWGFCVEWLDGTAPAAGTARLDFPPYQREKVDYMKVLDPETFKRFSEYRKRRKEISEADGVKPFVVMTDAQMAELAKMENPTKADLKKIEGFGEARVEKYADRLRAAGEGTQATEATEAADEEFLRSRRSLSSLEGEAAAT